MARFLTGLAQKIGSYMDNRDRNVRFSACILDSRSKKLRSPFSAHIAFVAFALALQEFRKNSNLLISDDDLEEFCNKRPIRFLITEEEEAGISAVILSFNDGSKAPGPTLEQDYVEGDSTMRFSVGFLKGSKDDDIAYRKACDYLSDSEEIADLVHEKILYLWRRIYKVSWGDTDFADKLVGLHEEATAATKGAKEEVSSDGTGEDANGNFRVGKSVSINLGNLNAEMRATKNRLGTNERNKKLMFAIMGKVRSAVMIFLAVCNDGKDPTKREVDEAIIEMTEISHFPNDDTYDDDVDPEDKRLPGYPGKPFGKLKDRKIGDEFQPYDGDLINFEYILKIIGVISNECARGDIPRAWIQSYCKAVDSLVEAISAAMKDGKTECGADYLDSLLSKAVVYNAEIGGQQLRFGDMKKEK